ncbi:MAG: thioredoxin domain-containing protein [Flavobacteriales bacterium]|jgi:uncharacterized protein|nr:thioredoxin domain-containing protein [Flavobacteriales bacterium]
MIRLNFGFGLFILLVAITFNGTTFALPGGNLLSKEASPYLQLHASDPVHWRPWGKEAFAEAKRLKRPIMLSIGYTACHWCHVMQRESFTDPETAQLINRLYVPVLIDREEHPDVDSTFQWQAVHMDLPSGWPLTMFLTPEGRPFFGGTYYPYDKKYGMMSFRSLLNRVQQVYAKDPLGITEFARNAAQTFAKLNRPHPGEITQQHQNSEIDALMAENDALAGGFGDAPKHPQWVALRLLWRAHIDTGRKDAGKAVLNSLHHMINGALYDHVGGGFYRYAVDPLWRTPHFEKMIDVNAGLLLLMTEVWRETRDPHLEKSIRGTVKFIQSELRLPSGAFASSLDADSIGPDGREEEGNFYIWSENQLKKSLGPNATNFLRAFSLAPVERKTIENANDQGVLYRQSDAVVDESLAILLKARAARHRPRRDDKILSDGNGMLIDALAKAAMALNEPKWLDVARQAFNASKRALSSAKGRLHQSAVHRGKEALRGPLATADGIATMAHAAITLYEATGEGTYLETAEIWADMGIRFHLDLADQAFYTGTDAAATTLRMKSVIDDPNPSTNARMIQLLARLYYFSGQETRRKQAERTLLAIGAIAREPQIGISGLLNAAHFFGEAIQVVIIGNRENTKTQNLLMGLMARSIPEQVLEIVPPGTRLPKSHPAHYKKQIDGLPTAYVCRGTVCSLPATDRAAFDDRLLLMRRNPTK